MEEQKRLIEHEPTPLALQFAEEAPGTLDELQRGGRSGQQTLPPPID